MSLKEKSEEIKKIVSSYESKWLLGNLSSLIHFGKKIANDQLGNLSSPMRQLYYLAGLNITSNKEAGVDFMYTPDRWNEIVRLLNEIEVEYQKLMFDFKEDEDHEKWKKIREVAVPSFMSYFNQGPLNYEEQIINWVRALYSNFDVFLKSEFNIETEDFILFYESLDRLVQNNLQGHTTNSALLRDNWEDYTTIESGMDENVPDFVKESIPERYLIMSKFMIDKGMIDRFLPTELVSENLSLDKINTILSLISTTREEKEFTYYTETKPGNPLYNYPIFDIENGMYQVFEVKQVIHSINSFLENIVTSDNKRKDKYLKNKGDLLENNIIELFEKFFGDEVKIYQSYYIDDCEQDILILWKDYAFIIEAKGYNLREPFRNPEKAFDRIKGDFKNCIGYGYEQTSRVEKIILEKQPLVIRNKKKEIIDTIDTTKIKEDFSIIVNQNSFGLVQCDLSYLLELNNEDDIHPWVVKFDDLEIFILTLIAKKQNPQYFIQFLLFREQLHGKLMCSDELEICGGYLTKKINPKKIKYLDIVFTHPDYGDVFDKQYRKTMGFKNEKYLYEKQSGKFLFM
ncbi:hypothetical protein [Labilibaculum euxinus]